MRPLRMFGCLALIALAGAPGNAQPLEVGELVVADDGSDSIIAIDPNDGSQRVIASGGSFVAPQAVAVDPTTLQVYVADRDAGSGSLGAVIRIDPAAYDPLWPGSNQVIVSQDGQLEEPLDVFVERDGQLLVAEGGGTGGVVRVDPATGAQTRLFDQAGAVGVVSDLSGTVYAASSTGANEILRKAPSQPSPELVSSGNYFTANGHIAFEPDGTLVVVDSGVGSALDGQVIRVDPEAIDPGDPGANQTIVSEATNLVDPRGVAVGAAGEIYVSDPAALAGAGAVYAVDPSTGVQTLIATGAPLAHPIGIDVARPGIHVGEIAVANEDSQGVEGQLLIVDPDTGAQRLVRSFAGLDPVDVELDANGDLLVLLTERYPYPLGLTPRVLRVDPATGLSEPVYIAGPPSETELRFPTKMVREGTHLFVSDYGGDNWPGAIFDIDLANGTNTLVTDYVGLTTPYVRLPVAIGLVPSSGDFLVLAHDSLLEEYELVRVDRMTLAEDSIVYDCICPDGTGNLTVPTDVVVTPDSATAYVTVVLAQEGAATGAAVAAVDLAAKTASPLTVPGDLIVPWGIALDAQGDLLVADWPDSGGGPTGPGQIVRFDPELTDPEPQLVSSGGLLIYPSGLVEYMPEPPAAISRATALLALAALARRRRRFRRR